MARYHLTLKGLFGDGPPRETTMAEAIEWARERYSVVRWSCEDADVLEIECPACEGVDDEADVYAVDGCRAIVSEPLYLDGPRDDDTHLRLERIDGSDG
jgi:hypothetical protein